MNGARFSYWLSIQKGRTALIWAAAEGHSSVVKLLIDAKADVNHADHVRHSTCIRWRQHTVYQHAYDDDSIPSINMHTMMTAYRLSTCIRWWQHIVYQHAYDDDSIPSINMHMMMTAYRLSTCMRWWQHTVYQHAYDDDSIPSINMHAMMTAYRYFISVEFRQWQYGLLHVVWHDVG
jgi:hypothetical protein